MFEIITTIINYGKMWFSLNKKLNGNLISFGLLSFVSLFLNCY